jgi:hypothetical protein
MHAPIHAPSALITSEVPVRIIYIPSFVSFVFLLPIYLSACLFSGWRTTQLASAESSLWLMPWLTTTCWLKFSEFNFSSAAAATIDMRAENNNNNI